MLPENKRHWQTEGYPNPTAGEAIERADREAKRKQKPKKRKRGGHHDKDHQ